MQSDKTKTHASTDDVTTTYVKGPKFSTSAEFQCEQQNLLFAMEMLFLQIYRYVELDILEWQSQQSLVS